MTRIRYVAASLIAPIAALLLPTLFAISELYGDAVQMPNGSFDDGAMRGAGLFIVLGLPVVYLVCSCYYAAAAHVLVKLRRLSLKAYLWAAGGAPWLAVLLALVSVMFDSRNVTDSLLIFVILGVSMSIFAVIGALTWWFIAAPNAPSNPSFQRTAYGSR